MATGQVYSAATSDKLNQQVSAGAIQQRSLRALLPLLNATTAGTQTAVAVIGNDIVEGAGASAQTKCWSQSLKNYLRQALGVASMDTGYGYVPAAFLTGDKTLATISGTAGTDYAIVTSDGGLGAKSVQLTTSGSTITFAAQACRYLKIHATNSFFGSGSFSVSVDGTVKQTITTTADQPSTENVTTIDLGSVATRSIVLKQTAGKPRIEGITFSTTTTGLTWLQGGHVGWRADQFASAPARMHGLVLANYPVSLTVLQFGLNDMAGSSSAPITAQQFANSMKSSVDALLTANPNMGVLILHDAMRLEDARSAPTAANGQTNYPNKLVEFQEAVRAVLGTYERVSILTLDDVWRPLAGGSRAAQDPLGWLADDTHPGDNGHNQIATYLASRITSNQIASAAEAKAIAQQALATVQAAAAPADTQMAAVANNTSSAFRTAMNGVYQPKQATTVDQQVSTLVGTSSSTRTALDNRYTQSSSLTSLMAWFNQNLSYGTSKFIIAQTNNSPANGGKAAYPIIGSLTGLGSGDTGYGLNLKRGKVGLRLDFIYQGPDVTTDSASNFADMLLFTINDATLCPSRTRHMIIYHNGVAAGMGRVDTDGKVTFTNGTFSGQTFAYRQEFRFELEWDWKGTF